MPAIKRQQAYTSKLVDTTALGALNDRDGAPPQVQQRR